MRYRTRPRKRLTAFLMASLCLIFLMSSCATTSIPRGFDAVKKGDTVQYDGQCIDNKGARDVAQKLEERRECLDREGHRASFWDKLGHSAIFLGAGFALGIVLVH